MNLCWRPVSRLFPEAPGCLEVLRPDLCESLHTALAVAASRPAAGLRAPPPFHAGCLKGAAGSEAGRASGSDTHLPGTEEPGRAFVTGRSDLSWPVS